MLAASLSCKETRVKTTSAAVSCSAQSAGQRQLLRMWWLSVADVNY